MQYQRQRFEEPNNTGWRNQRHSDYAGEDSGYQESLEQRQGRSSGGYDRSGRESSPRNMPTHGLYDEHQGQGQPLRSDMGYGQSGSQRWGGQGSSQGYGQHYGQNSGNYGSSQGGYGQSSGGQQYGQSQQYSQGQGDYSGYQTHGYFNPGNSGQSGSGGMGYGGQGSMGYGNQYGGQYGNPYSSQYGGQGGMGYGQQQYNQSSGWGGSSGQYGSGMGGQGYGNPSRQDVHTGGFQRSSGWSSGSPAMYGQPSPYGSPGLQRSHEYGSQSFNFEGGPTATGAPYGSGRPSRGQAPRSYKRSDERICEAACERLIDEGLDCSSVDIVIKEGIATITGEVQDRSDKYRIEQIVLDINGVNDVENQLRLKKDQNQDSSSRSGRSSDRGSSSNASGSSSGNSSGSSSGSSSQGATGIGAAATKGATEGSSYTSSSRK